MNIVSPCVCVYEQMDSETVCSNNNNNKNIKEGKIK